MTEEKLWRIAGTRDLGSVAHLELVIDSSRQTVDNLGELVPGLHTLSLDGSNLCSLRDLGTALDKLHTLSLNSSKVCGWGVYCYDFLLLPSTSYYS